MDAFSILALVVLGLVLVIAWIVLPFAVIGLKPLLRTLIEETKKTNWLLEKAQAHVDPKRPPLAPTHVSAGDTATSDTPFIAEKLRILRASGCKIDRGAYSGWKVTFPSGEVKNVSTDDALMKLADAIGDSRHA